MKPFSYSIIKLFNHSVRKTLILLLCSLIFISCESEKPVEIPVKIIEPETPSIPLLDYSVTATFKHDSTAFTEGLLFNNGVLYESTGSPDNLPKLKSVIGVSDLKTGKLSAKVELDRNIYFGEGIVILNNKIYQATYTNQTGFIYDTKTFNRVGQFSYINKEGWGMTTDGTNIIMSDGSDMLTFFEPKEFKVIKTISVNENRVAVDDINELEFINGFIYANIWMTGYIAKIDPATGNIVAKINCTPLNYQIKNFHPYALEMNGIAYDAEADKIYVTGKLWPEIYQINFKH